MWRSTSLVIFFWKELEFYSIQISTNRNPIANIHLIELYLLMYPPWSLAPGNRKEARQTFPWRSVPPGKSTHKLALASNTFLWRYFHMIGDGDNGGGNWGIAPGLVSVSESQPATFLSRTRYLRWRHIASWCLDALLQPFPVTTALSIVSEVT